MADNIVGGLFGVDPQQLMQQRQATDMSNAFRYAQLDPLQQAKMSIYQGSAGLARGVGGLLGGDPELEKVSKIKQLSSQFDLTTPTGMRDFARALQPVAPNEAMMAAKRADEMMATQEQTALRSAQTQQAEAGKVIQIDLGDRIQLVNALTREVIREIPKGLTPAQAAKASAGDGTGAVGKPGAVGKAGAWRDVYGDIIPPVVMKDVQKEFKAAQNLYDTLSQVSETDVKNAESYVDWTTKAETKALASEKTLTAQTKIAASQLMEQINQLPPGSASDADMKASMKSFPGYSNANALAAWVNETKRKLERTINIGVEQYGLKPNVKFSAALDLTKKKPTGQTTTSDDDLVNKYLKAKTQ